MLEIFPVAMSLHHWFVPPSELAAQPHVTLPVGISGSVRSARGPDTPLGRDSNMPVTG